MNNRGVFLWKNRVAIPAASLVTLFIVMLRPCCSARHGILAQTELTRERPPLRVRQLIQGPLQQPSSTSKQPSQSGVTLPSLWWINRQFGNKLVIDWFAYDSEMLQSQQVQIFIRSNLWTRFSYFERYAFITHFGALTRAYGYQLLLLDTVGNPLGSYLCQFETQEPQIITGARTNRQRKIRLYSGPSQTELPCDIWMSNAFPRGAL